MKETRKGRRRHTPGAKASAVAARDAKAKALAYLEAKTQIGKLGLAD
jgi:hypothetical protein